MGHIFLRFVGIRVVVRPQCKSVEYFFRHRPSFAVESNLIYGTTFYKIKKMHFARVIETVFFSSSNHPFSWFLLEIGVHLFKIHHKEAPSIHGAAANFSIKSALFFKDKFGNILKKMGWGGFALALMGHIRACLFYVLWLLVPPVSRYQPCSVSQSPRKTIYKT